jgi:hypothetical protein
MTTILAFPSRPGRTSPQREGKSVAVNVTAPDCEAVRDMFNEARIRVLASLWRTYWSLGHDAEAMRVWRDYGAAKAKRSPELVARIENARGLR